MSTKIEFLKKISPVYACYIGIILVLLIAGAYLNFGSKLIQPSFDAATLVSAMGKGDKSVFEEVRDSMKEIIQEGGIQGMIDVNEYALVNNLYGIYQCHVISHLTGHEAVVYYGNDYDAVVAHDNHFCEIGYRHGAEAQVALSGGDYKNELYKMCDAIQRKNPDAECFHGAGHAYMNESLDVDLSLQMCDELINETHTEADVTPCYNAVFAELTNLVGGTDGGTGIEYTGGAPLTMEEKTPLEYCSKFKPHYRLQCVFEFSGLGVNEHTTQDDIAGRIKDCANDVYGEELESACIRSVSAVGAQHILAHSDTLSVPPHVLTLSKPLRDAFILGVGTEMKQYIISGAPRDWQSFCDGFSDSEDNSLCTSIFNET